MNSILKQTLDLVDHELPWGEAISQTRWELVLPTYNRSIQRISEILVSDIKHSLPRRVFSESTTELVNCRQPNIIVSEFRFRPISAYYKQVGKSIPAPENPHGYSATGIELSLRLCRSYPQGHRLHSPCLSVQFSIWGERERSSFREFFLDHRRFVSKLLENRNFKFSTAGPFENVDKFKGSNTPKKLELYLANDLDPENHFAIEKDFHQTHALKDLSECLLHLMVLYDTALGYCRPRKDRDRALASRR